MVTMAVGILLVGSPAFSAESTRGPTVVVVSDADATISYVLNSLGCSINGAAAIGECSPPWLSHQIAGSTIADVAGVTATIGKSVSAVRTVDSQAVVRRRVVVAAALSRKYPPELPVQLLLVESPSTATPEEVRARSGTTFLSGAVSTSGRPIARRVIAPESAG